MTECLNWSGKVPEDINRLTQRSWSNCGAVLWHWDYGQTNGGRWSKTLYWKLSWRHGLTYVWPRFDPTYLLHPTWCTHLLQIHQTRADSLPLHLAVWKFARRIPSLCPTICGLFSSFRPYGVIAFRPFLPLSQSTLTPEKEASSLGGHGLPLEIWLNSSR